VRTIATAAACPHEDPIVGGTPETDAIAAAPARCGQPAHAWRDDPSLGEVVAYGTTTPSRLAASGLADIATSQGFSLPEPPRYDVGLGMITYVTQDRGALVDATALVAWPRDLPAGAPAPDLVLFLHGSSGYADRCGPTRDVGGQVLSALLASLGWIVVAPDYLGMRGDGMASASPHPYLVGQPTAIAALDAARAAIAMDPTRRAGLCTSGRVLVLGGSQGGHAALWTERLAPYYARELDVVGTVATVPPADCVAQVERALRAVVPATRSSIVFFGLAPHWYGAPELLADAFVPSVAVDVTERLGVGCEPGGPISPGTLEEVFAPGILDAASRGELATYGDLGCMLRESALTATTIPRLGGDDPSYAILYVLGGADTLVDPAIERASASTLCAAGAPIQFLECEGAEHIQGTAWALPEIVEFARARFARQVPPPGSLCALAPAVRCRGTP
jgi:dienelactone hydrolase